MKRIILTVMLVLSMCFQSFALEMEPRYDVPLDKEWNIKFNQPFDLYSIDESNVYIEDADWDIIGSELYYIDDYTISVKPDEDYKPNSKYWVVVNTNVKSDSGQPLNDITMMEFNTVGATAQVPQNVDAVAVSHDEITLSWDAVAGAEYYYVYGSNSYDGSYVKSTATYTETSVTYSGIGPDTTKYMKVSAVVNGVESEVSEMVYATTFSAPVQLVEMHLYSSDGTYLGELTTNEFDSDSVFNSFGSYGSQFSQTSIWNEFSQYGSEFSDKSAFNQFAQNPPKIYKGDEFIGYLTVNQFKTPGISPYNLKAWLQSLGY